MYLCVGVKLCGNKHVVIPHHNHRWEAWGWQSLRSNVHFSGYPLGMRGEEPGSSSSPRFSPHRAYVFRAQSAEMKERGGNQTSGIDFFITQERIVFLDTQVPAPAPLPGPLHPPVRVWPPPVHLCTVAGRIDRSLSSVPSGVAWVCVGPDPELQSHQLWT